MWKDLATERVAELSATRRQAIVYRGLKYRSTTDLWSPESGYDSQEILRWSELSVVSWCEGRKVCSN